MTDSEHVDLLIEPEWLLPIEPAARVWTEAAVAVRAGRITHVGPRAELAAQLRPAAVERLPGQVLMPGFVNAHGHAAMSLLRGYADDQPLNAWLNDHIWPAEAQWVSEEFVRDGTRLACLEMLAGGTTCFADMYFYPEVAALEAHAAGMRAQIAFPIMEFPTAWGSGPDDYLQKGLALHDAYRTHDRLSIAFGPHAPYTVSDATFGRIATLAAELQAPIHIHVHETQGEVDDALAAGGPRPLARLQSLGVLGPLTQCVHMTALTPEDIERVRASGASVVHCPESNMKLASGACPVAALLAAGINVALGTDGAASNNDLSMLGEMGTAALLAKLSAGRADVVSAHETLAMATLGGARALGLEGQIGSLVPGKAADMIAVDLQAPEFLPRFDVASQLVYNNRSAWVSKAWVAGQVVLEDGRPTRLNPAQICARAVHWQEQLNAARSVTQ